MELLLLEGQKKIDRRALPDGLARDIYQLPDQSHERVTQQDNAYL